ncbi:MAG: hypothetical protein E4G71_05890 [Candidatus Atribacteria bacterium]|nr:MAG: hypothetical protein E4G71_05890 [Candidatus Atribacteria bacterium]
MKKLIEVIISLILIFIFVEYILYLENLYSFAIGLFLFMPFSSFIIAPLMRVRFFFKFYSKILLVQFPNKKVYDLHLANNFDLIRFSKNCNNAKKMIFLEIVEGLLNICEEIEQEKLPKKLNIQAITFFMNHRTFKKLGFKKIRFSPQYAILFLFDYIGITISNYFVSKKFRFVNIIKTSKASMTGEDLIQNKKNLIEIKLKLKLGKNYNKSLNSDTTRGR